VPVCAIMVLMDQLDAVVSTPALHSGLLQLES